MTVGRATSGIAAWLALVLLAACSFSPPRTYHPPKDADLARAIEPARLREDLEFLVRTLRETHRDLHHHVPRGEFDAHAARIAAELDHPMTREEFFWLLAPLVASVGDGHTTLSHPSELFAAHVAAEGRVFPIDVRIEDARLLVVAAHEPGIEVPPGSSITSIEGTGADAIVRSLLAVQSAERPAYAEQRAVFMFRDAMFGRFGAPAAWDVEWTDPSGHERAGSLPGLTRTELYARRSAGKPPAPTPNYSLRMIDGDRVAVIDFRSMNDREAFGKFLDEAFARICKEQPRALVVDLRNNGGGSSMLGDMLLDRVTDEPFCDVSLMEVRSSRQYRSYLKGHVPWIIRWLPIQHVHSYGRLLWAVRPGEVAAVEGAMWQPTRERNKYRGPVVLLIGPRTYSSATMLAATAKDFGLATLVGEETGGLATHYGEVLGFTLPNSRLYAGVAVKRFVRPSGVDDGRGVLPDIEVRDVPGNDSDEAMERVLGMLRRGETLPRCPLYPAGRTDDSPPAANKTGDSTP